jgi:hypothetical protein
MAAYRHHVSGFFPDRAPAEMTLKTLRQRGFNAAQLHIYSDNADVPPAPAPMAQSNAALKDMLVDGAIGTAVGTGIGGLMTIALIATNVSVFIASPLLAPLMLLGWGASLGALTGEVLGTSDASDDTEGKFADLVMAAIKHGDAVLVAETTSEAETTIAREIIADSVGKFKDLNMLEPIPGNQKL